ncbi:MAG: MBL fold metallo-hydrolase [Anaerolineaceae bacterium]|nr:MBL fold metallo-hydrolase [Anaerolineaceae bacterium]
MKIHHLNCGSMHPYFPRVHSLAYCLLVESSAGLVLIDTGLGTQDYQNPAPIVRAFIASVRVPRDPAETALHQVQAVGFSPEDVQHIVMTHMHFDHAGGLSDFPHAQVHIHQNELKAAKTRKGFLAKGCIPAHWSHGPHWVTYSLPTEKWFGFDAIPLRVNLLPRILLIPLPGHSPGHCGVAVERDSGWLLHCGDSTYPFYHDGHPDQPINSPPDWLVRWLLGPWTPRLKELYTAHGHEIKFITSHDPVSFKLFSHMETY